MTERDNFSAATKRTLAARVGHHCTNPGCMRATSGPALDEQKAVNVGEAAHITAAARGGKRFDPALTPSERCAEANGIWLCEFCAKLIDTDEARFTGNLLRKWKRDALDRALKDITTLAPGTYQRPALIMALDDDDRAFLRSLALPAEDDLDTVLARMREAATRDIAAFRAAKEWPAHTISLSLTLHASGGRHSISIEGMAKGIDVAEVLNLVSPPGTGKTTTLVQLAGTILEAGQTVAALVPLGEWSDRLEDFFEFMARRNAFRAFRPQHFMQLAYHGRLALMLDGWNELDPESRIRATRDLKALRRDYPLLGIVIGTRRHQLPISGSMVEIEALSESQQMELARALRGGEGEALVDQAWRTAGVRELIAIPLYLTALLGSTPGARFPQTKEEVLRLFVTQHEQVPEKAEILRKELFGFHGDMLIGLAVEANRSANTVLSDTNARRVISDVEAGLAARGQLTAPPQPGTVIDVLVNGHILVRSSSGGDGISFQHQQFQEWYASFDVARLMTHAAGGDVDARSRLRTDVLNWPAWEESILFACERLSRENTSGVQAVAAAIRDALGIDPMLAAEMIFRSASEVWALLSAKTVAFAARWHTPGKIDRAARFMMTTGRPEFAPQIWPLISNPDNQIYLTALRLARRFRPSVLGDDAEGKLAALPEETRRHVVAEIASNSGFDGMELAVRVAMSDPSERTVVEVLQSLQFRGADRLVGEILQSASDQVWQRVARKGYPDELADPDQNARLIELREGQVATETNPVQILGNLAAHRQDTASSRARIAELIASVDFPIQADHAGLALQRASDAYPDAVREGLLRRIAGGSELPYRAHELLTDVAPVDDGPITVVALDGTTPERVARGAFAVIGPKTVGMLIDQLLALNEEYQRDREAWSRADQQAKRDEFQRLKDAIGVARTDSFLAAFLERAGTDQPARIELMADLLSWHARRHEEERLNVREESRPALLRALQCWIDALLGSPQANRHQFAHVVNAIVRLPDPQFVPGLQRMLERDLADWARAREERARSRRGGPSSPDVTHSHTLEYQRAFAAIGDEATIRFLKGYLANLQFGMNAAGALFEIWNREHPSNKARYFASWHDYSNAKALQKQRRESPETLSTSDFAEAIFEVVRSIGAKDADAATQRHAVALAVIGLGLPHGTKRAEIDELMELPLPLAAKQRLLIGAAMAGEIIPADTLVARLRELLETGRTESWRLRGDHGEVMGWVELFAFSDHPEAVLGILDLLPGEYRWPRSLERLLTALSKSPSEGALGVLQALARRDARMLADYDWANAVIKLGTEESARALIAHICDGELTTAHGLDTFHLANHLARFGDELPAIKTEMMQRFERMSAGRAKSILEAALVELANQPVILALINGYAADRRPYDGGLSRAVRKVALGQRTVEGWVAGAYQEFSVSLAALRRELFGIAVANEARSALADRCLISIEKLRDEHGRVDDEPRHPDIASGQAWPLIK